MKNVVSVGLLLVVLNFSFNQAGIYLRYLIDIEAYTEAFCENKDRPEMQCNGKCHLAEELAKTVEDTSESQELPKPLELIQFFLPAEYMENPDDSDHAYRPHEFYYPSDLIENPSKSFFRPPQMLFS